MKLIYQLNLNGGHALQISCDSLKPQRLRLGAITDCGQSPFRNHLWFITPALQSPCQEVWHRFSPLKWSFQTSRTGYRIIILLWKPQDMLCGKKRHLFGISQWDSRKTIWRKTVKVRGFPKRGIDGMADSTKLPQLVIFINLSLQLLGGFSFRKKSSCSPWPMMDWCEGWAAPCHPLSHVWNKQGPHGVCINWRQGNKQNKTQSLD